MQYKVYQFQLSNQDIEDMNAGRRMDLAVAFHTATALDTEFGLMVERYAHVATVEANDLEHLFQICNLWEAPERVTEHLRMTSVSVGDLVADENGQLWRCQAVGWRPLQHLKADDLGAK